MEERRLHRSASDRIMFGVCGGLAEYFDVDATLVRLIFVVITVAGGWGILAYIVLAIIMPPESAVARQPREIVRENIAELGSRARDMGEQIRAGLAGGSGTEGEVVEGEVSRPARATRDRHATAGLILILIGVLFLLGNMGLLGWFSFRQLWPLILIAIGLAIIWGRGRR